MRIKYKSLKEQEITDLLPTIKYDREKMLKIFLLSNNFNEQHKYFMFSHFHLSEFIKIIDHPKVEKEDRKIIIDTIMSDYSQKNNIYSLLKKLTDKEVIYIFNLNGKTNYKYFSIFNIIRMFQDRSLKFKYLFVDNIDNIMNYFDYFINFKTVYGGCEDFNIV